MLIVRGIPITKKKSGLLLFPTKTNKDFVDDDQLRFQSLKPCRHMSGHLFLIIAKLLVKVWTVWASLHCQLHIVNGKWGVYREDGTDEHAMVLLEGLLVGFGEGRGESFVFVISVEAESDSGKVEASCFLRVNRYKLPLEPEESITADLLASSLLVADERLQCRALLTRLVQLLFDFLKMINGN